MSKLNLGNLSFYCIYTRNHTESGTFQGVIDDLPRFVFNILLLIKNEFVKIESLIWESILCGYFQSIQLV
jgi:hypothetical protein